MNRSYTVRYLNVSAEAHIDGDLGKLSEVKPGSAVFRSSAVARYSIRQTGGRG